jgi:precorrin-6B methylase 2
MSNDTFKEDFAGHLLGLSRGFMASRIFLTAVELNVFGLLGTGRLTSVELASRMSADVRATEILLNALTGMGLLEKKGDEFANIEVLVELLLPDSPDYLGGFGNAIHLWDAWSHLTEIVKTGRPFIAERTDGARRDFALCMKQYAQGTVTALARHVGFSDVNCMLDLGGGTGAHAIALARQHRQMRVVLFDKDEQALELAGLEIARESLNDRIALKSGDFFADDLGQGYDLVLLSSVICLFGEEQNLSLLRRVWASLASGGRIVTLDSIVDSSRTRPTAAALFAVNMLITSHGGQSHSHNQVESWLRSAGFEDARRIPLHGSQIIMAKKGFERDSEWEP